jgi:hypothetical protein
MQARAREVIAAYLIRRMHEGRTTPTEAVNVVAAHVEKQAEEMVAAGTPQQRIFYVGFKGCERPSQSGRLPIPDRSTRSIAW